MHISRRDFIKGGICLLSSTLFFQSCDKKEAGTGNARGEGGAIPKPVGSKIVVISGANHEKALELGLDAFDGIKSMVEPEAKVVIKPNFVTAEPYPATTDVPFIIAVIKRFQDMGFRNIMIVDCSHKSSFKYNKIEEKSLKIGAKAQFCEPNDLTQYGEVINERWVCFDKLRVQKDILEADFVINLPVLKRHHSASLTCAMKNQMGSVNGTPRYFAHGKFKFGNRDFFMNAVAEFADAVRPELTILDAREILIKGGPSLKRGEVKKGINKLLISSDMVALDSYSAEMMEQEDPSFSHDMMERTLAHGVELGLGIKDLDGVEIKEIQA